MKKKILLFCLLLTTLLTGCGESKRYGNISDWDEFNKEHKDCHVRYASSDDGCYSDGSFESNFQFELWLEQYKLKHQ